MARHAEKSMVEGSILPLLLNFSLPLLAGNLFQQLYNVVDASIVGKTLGSSALAAVGVSSSVQFMVLGFCIGVAIGFGIPVATQFGAGHEHLMRQYVYIGAILTGIIAVVITVLTSVFCGGILTLLRTPEEIRQDAWEYLFTIFLGLPCTLAYNYLSGVLRSIGNSRTPFLFLAFSSVLNIFLDLFCILVLHWGCFGAAFATVVSQGVSAVLCWMVIRKHFAILHLRPEDKVWDRTMALRDLNMGVPMGLQYSITAIGTMVMQTCNNTLGTLYVSAYAAGLKIKQFALSPFDAFATAASTFCAQNYGAGHRERLKKGVLTGLAIELCYSVAAALVLVFFGRTLSLLFLDASETAVLDASAKYLRYIGLFYPMLGTLVLVRQVVQGLGWSQRAMLGGVIEMFARIAVCLIFTPAWGYTAICCADQAAWTTAVVYLVPVLLIRLKKIEREQLQ